MQPPEKYNWIALVVTFVRIASFPLAFFMLLWTSTVLPLPMARYDFLFLGACAIQGILWLLREETGRDMSAIVQFHLLGLALEIYKTSQAIASWAYPEFGVFKIGNVPLYSGFMYAAVGSFLLQGFKHFHLHLRQAPPYGIAFVLACAVYLNFFTHHHWIDLRYSLLFVIILLFWRAHVVFHWQNFQGNVPLLGIFFALGGLLWAAENLATWLGAWVYPHQKSGWRWVSTSKVLSWMLLVIFSFILVARQQGAWNSNPVETSS